MRTPASSWATRIVILGSTATGVLAIGCSASDSDLGNEAPDAGSTIGGAGASASGAATNGGSVGVGGVFGSSGATSGGGTSSLPGSTGGDASGGGGTPSSGGAPSVGGTAPAGDSGSGGNVGSGGSAVTGGATGTGDDGGSCTTPPPPSPLLGWASVEDGGTRTTGGDGAATTTVTTLSDLNDAVKGTTAATVLIRGTIDGDVTIGSNKTLVGVCGATIHGHVSMTKSVNVIVRNLTIVGKNCTDSPSDCSAGDDAITVQDAAHHLWFDHDDISDGSDGNLDMTHASDFITISWTKFHYSGRRVDPAGAAGGHQFSNLIGHSDSNASEDTGHLRITIHHSWWADNVVERMPRARFGRVHLFDNLYTSTGNDYCIGVGNGVNILSENNVFIGVANPIKSYSTDGTGLIRSSGNVYTNTTGTNADLGSGTAFTPGYSVALDPAAGLEAAIRVGAGPH